MEVVSAVLGFTCQLWECIANNTVCSHHLADELNSLKTQKEKLVELRNDVSRRVEDAQRRRLQPTEQVSGWLRRVDDLVADVDNIVERGEEEAHNKCMGICPRNCWATHKLWKKVCGRLQVVSEVKSEGEFGSVAEKLPLLAADEMPLGRTVGLDSRADEVLKFLRDDRVRVLGVYGMGGVGKTTVLKKVNNMLADLSAEFREVIWVVASKDVNYEMIQDKIGRKLGLTDEAWRNKNEEEKAMDVYGVLKDKKFVLLLDDIWKRFDLERVGVPIPNEENKGKVVFTTRSEFVCGLMEAEKKIKVECLEWQEAWDLFGQKVGNKMLINSDAGIGRLARMVCKECGGLPLALITVGRAMACRTTLHEWNYAIDVLKKSISQFSGLGDEVFPLLKFSYDSLTDETIKACFLYCSLYPEDRYIHIGETQSLWIGEGFFDDCDSPSEGRKKAYDVVTSLKHACLLETIEGDNRFSMHDMVRDMALWIASECGRERDKYLVQAGLNLTSAPASSKWEPAQRISLMFNHIEDLSGSPACPNLLTLLVGVNHLRYISNDFFHQMPAVRVLDLSWNTNLTRLPTSIGNLISLQYLDLQFTSIRELPVEFKSLVKLKQLSMENMDKLERIPPQVISSLSMLQTLQLFGTGGLEVIEDGNIFCGGSEQLSDELECLNHLEEFTLTLKSEFAVEKLLRSGKLSRRTRGLSIMWCRGSSSLRLSSLQNNESIECLQIRKCEDLKEISIDLVMREEEDRLVVPHSVGDIKSFYNLKVVIIAECKHLKDVTWLSNTSSLQRLKIYKCEAMEEVIKEVGVDANQVFSRLNELFLYELPELKSIYSGGGSGSGNGSGGIDNAALGFPCLKEIHVFECPKLKKLALDSNSAINSLRVIGGQREWWDELDWETEATRSLYSPLFQCFEAPTTIQLFELYCSLVTTEAIYDI